MDRTGGEDSAPETLGDLGEWELIRRLGSFAPEHQFSDDAALLPAAAPGDGGLVINTDVLVEGIHFSDATTGAADVGWRAAAANLSDLAAMGCSTLVGLTVGLVAPAATPWSWVQEVYTGLAAALKRYGGVLLGGDCSGGAQRLLAITALGRLPTAGGPIRRGDGLPGDVLVGTGPHGLSRLGLALLQGDVRLPAAAGIDPALPDLAARALKAHRRPRPRLDAVQNLIASRPAQLPWRVAGCDSSDGLAAAVRAIAAASGCAALLDRKRLPLDGAMAALPQAEAWCLGGGEDFELVLALPPAWAEALLATLPHSSRFGELMAGPPGELLWTQGGTVTAGSGGYQHFQ
ncbi:thiamine-phosphate kinase [Cyanobium sp. FGCU-52]|nr:thiamine-phosphate kinase [Cyanobium sp. FGCU52]